MATEDYSGVGKRTEADIREMSAGMSSLQETHPMHEKYKDEWGFLQAAYDGAKALVAYGAILRHERESNTNYKRRQDEAYGFSYSRSVVDLFNFYLFKETCKRQLGKLADDSLWAEFTEDCNLEQDSFDDFLLEAGKISSVQGHVGILVDKPNVNIPNLAEHREKSVYPYVVMYTPLNILDWEYERDDFNRPRLVMLKVKDDDDLYRIWTLEKWEIWEVADEDDDDAIKGEDGTYARMLDSGENHLDEIPWIWLYNTKTRERGVGYSDIGDISRIDASIIRNLSQGEEIINYAAFPMMRKPYREGGKLDKDDVGVTAVLEFPPEHPESKPDWLEARVQEPINAIFTIVIAKKIEEIYRSANVGGMAATEIQTQAKSGAAMKAEFQLLNGKLVSKGKSIEKAEKEIIRLWLKWMKMDGEMKNISIERAETYEVENLAQDLENILTAKTIVMSKEFSRRIQKKVIRLMLPGESDEEIEKVDKDIDDSVDNPPELDFNMPPEGTKIPGKPLPGEEGFEEPPKKEEEPGKVIPLAVKEK